MCVGSTTFTSLSTLTKKIAPLTQVNRMFTSVVRRGQGSNQLLAGSDRGVAGRDRDVAVYHHVKIKAQGVASHHLTTLPLHYS